jgi:hypothetical protein
MKRGCLIGQEAHRKRKVKDGEVPTLRPYNREDVSPGKRTIS